MNVEIEPKIVGLYASIYGTLNSSKTEFLLIRLKNQLAKIHKISLHLTPATLLETPALSLRTILLSLTKLQLSPKPVTITLVNFAVSSLTLIRQLPVPLLPLLSTPCLITVILSTINSLSLNYPISSRFKTLLLVLSLKLQSPVLSLPSYALFTGSWSLKTSNTSSSHLPTKFSTTQRFYFHNLISIQRPRSTLWSLFIRCYSCLATFIILSKNNWSLPLLCFTLSLESAPFASSSTLFWYQFFHFLLTYFFTHYFFLLWFTTLYIYNSLSLSLPAWNLSVSQILTPVVWLFPFGLPPRTIAWTASSELVGFWFDFFNFCFWVVR